MENKQQGTERESSLQVFQGLSSLSWICHERVNVAASRVRKKQLCLSYQCYNSPREDGFHQMSVGKAPAWMAVNGNHLRVRSERMSCADWNINSKSSVEVLD